MPRKRNAAPAGEVDQTPPAEGTPSSDVQADGGAAATVVPDNDNRSEEVMVVQTTEEPVRFGGHVLTDQGWVVEDALVPEDAADDEGDPAPETEQE